MYTSIKQYLYYFYLSLLIVIAMYLVLEWQQVEHILWLRAMMLTLVISTWLITRALKKLKHLHLACHQDLQKLRYIEEEIVHYRQHRHDIKNHMIVMYELAHAGQDEALLSYAKTLIDQTSHALVELKTGTIELDVLLYSKLEIARLNGIDMQLDLSCQIDMEGKSVVNMVSLFSNLIDNAIEATLAIEIPHERYVGLTLTEDPLDLVLTITNSFSPRQGMDTSKIFKRGYTSKEDKGNHGMGLTIVRSLVKKLKGEIQLKIFNGVFFQLTVSIPKHLL